MTGRGGPLALAGGVTALGLFFLLGASGIRGEAAYAGVGPRAFPIAIGGGLALLGAALAVAVLRGMEFRPEAGEDVDPEAPVDHRAAGGIVAGLALAAVLVEPLGFPLVAALLFVLTARGFGSRRLARDAAIGLVLSAAAFIVFARGLGVSLPGGPLERLF
ncbi:MAG: hypothetical protein A2X52_07730 [Candidatus Rokubacteria bacterium GWC2_70_16]|nr:MAG: hypothetical protein A2X52_07730 [Candidatus Rokubacteria bacterium GWC2_70_16]OGL20184.1 MAG: hypothetical protein A3K12_05265 [Candidatus Rokubacteria bacterium RIFCSPLOWO2_12_FULL_71_19]